jgi:outer membrane protein OmpA-like peptidoglycan-associated protein
MRVRLFPATAPIAPESARNATLTAGRNAVRKGRPDARVASTLAIAMVLALVTGGDAMARSRVTIDDSVLESLGPEPTIASLMLRPPRGMANPTRPSAQPAPRAVAQAPVSAPRSRLLLPGGAPASTPSPTVAPTLPMIAAAPPALRLPPMTAMAAAPVVRPAPAEVPRSRLMTAPVLRPPAPALESAPQLALAPPAPVLTPAPAPALLPTPPVAPLASGVRAAPAQAPRSQLLLPPALGERAPAPAPVAAAPAPAPTSSWPSLAGAAIAAPLPPSVALPPPAPAAPVPTQQVAAAAPTARDIQPPAPLSTPAVAPSAAPSPAPSANAGRPQAILSRLLFQRGTMDPADGSREALARLAEQLVATPGRRVEIQAYAAGAGNETENSNEARRLSLDRALAVRSGLVQRGVQSNRVTVRSLGNVGGEGPPDRVDIVLLGE